MARSCRDRISHKDCAFLPGQGRNARAEPAPADAQPMRGTLRPGCGLHRATIIIHWCYLRRRYLSNLGVVLCRLIVLFVIVATLRNVVLIIVNGKSQALDTL